MSRRILLLAALPLALVLAGCGLSRDTSATSTAATTAVTTATTTGGHVPVSPAPIEVVTYFLRDGKVAPVATHVPHTLAVATASLNGLFGPAPDGYDDAVRTGSHLVSVSIDAGVATVVVPDAADVASPEAQAQIVYTLTRFPNVTGVRIQPEHGTPPGSGEPLTRDDYEPQTPRILVDSPAAGSTVASPLEVKGTSNDYEATFQLELVQDGRKLAAETVTATSGNGVRGTFAQRLEFTGHGPATLVAYERNAGEGPPELGRVEIPVELG